MNSSNVYDIVKDAARQWPDNIAVFDQFGSISFSQLYTETENLRLQLLSLGITNGMAVGIKAHNSRNFIIALFAVF